MRAVVDTNVFYEAADRNAPDHGTARSIVTGIDDGDLPTAVVPDYVIAETLNLTNERLGSDTATALLDRIVECRNFAVRRISESDFETARALFRERDALSFVDATVATHMDREGIRYLYSFDDDFDAVDGITRVESATAPR